MNITRIESTNPSRYNWNLMTAREIIQYKDKGVDVPSQYLQWARDFINSVYSDDDTTYQIAKSRQDDLNSNVSEENSSSSSSSSNVSDRSLNSSFDSGMEDSKELNNAELKKKQFDEDGINLYKQALIFSVISRVLTTASFVGENFGLKNEERSSNSEIAKLSMKMDILDNFMSNQSDKLESILNVLKNSDENNDVEVKIAAETGENLEKASAQGHNEVSKSEDKLGSIGGNIEGFLPLFNDTSDYGEQSVLVGRQLSRKGLFAFILGISAMYIGKNAISRGTSGLNSEHDAENLNNNNIINASSWHNYITQKSGVENPNSNKENKSLKNSEDNIEQENSELGQDNSQEIKNQNNVSNSDDRQRVLQLRENTIGIDEKAVNSYGIVDNLDKLSDDTYADFTSDIENLMSEIDRLHDQIITESKNINSNLSANNISKINQLNQELKTYGSSAQMIAGNYGNTFGSYLSEVSELGTLFNESIDTGTLTSEAGTKLVSGSKGLWSAFRFVNEIIGKSAINIGNRTVNDGDKGLQEQQVVAGNISSNISEINDKQSEIEEKTGVESVKTATPIKPENNDASKEEDEKSVKTAQNDGSDNSDKLNISINEILKRKIRKGFESV